MSSSPMRWSACEWVKSTKARRGIGSRNSCRRRSVEVSIRKYFPFASHLTDCRRRLFFGFAEVQTRHEQPTTGTPVEVPVPRKEILMGGVFVWPPLTRNSKCKIQNAKLIQGNFEF